jgi:hypothetical protein
MLTISRYELTWDTYSQWVEESDQIGGIYSNEIIFSTEDDYRFTITFRVGEGRQLGLLFCEVVMNYPNLVDSSSINYCMGQFFTNSGAKLFAQFALNNFIETEKWLVCPSIKWVDYINGEPYTLGGDEIVSELI